jgi:hypothetical protein
LLHGSGGRRATLLAFLLLAFSIRTFGSETAAFLEFIYVDANVGSSSGGHAALKIGDSVYHFQNDQGYTRLARDRWNRFRFVYNDVDNRNIHIARVRVKESDAERVRDRFSVLFQVQNRHVDFLHALERDTELLRSLAQGGPFAMPGPGFFERRSRESPALHGLQTEIARRLGPGFVDSERKRLARELSALAYRPIATEDVSPKEDRYPQYPQTFSERAENLYAHWFALAAIQEEWPIRDGLLIDATEHGGIVGRMVLPESERRWLTAYRERLVDAILGGLEARHAGSGFPLLLAIARFTAVSESLAANRLLLLDVVSASRSPERLTNEEDRREPLKHLLQGLQADLSRLRRNVFASEEPEEAAYNLLENRVAQIREIQRGLASDRPISFLRRTAPPEGWGAALLPLPSANPVDMEQAAKTARMRAEEFRDLLEALYPYGLIGRNCVTELVRAVESAFGTREEASSALGGYLETGENLGFIPRRFFDLVQQNYRTESVTILPSYRNRMLRRLANRGDAWSVYAAEASTWTSSLYEPQAGDTLFLLFTEEVFWPRPLYGAINLAYGLGGAAVGFLAAPFDQGHQIREGLRGALFSLPELAFGNIRKGSFDGTRSRMDRRFEMSP